MFSDLIFEDRRHLYFVDNVIYPSVSSLIKKHEVPVDWDQMLIYCANKEKCEPHELKNKWNDKKDTALELGTNTHNFLEMYEGIQTPKTNQEKAGVKFIAFILKDYYILFRELRMYSKKYKYAGTTDLVLIHKETGDIVLADYKTNSVDLFKQYLFLDEPFEYLDNCAFNKYQLQLSYYQIMLEEIGVKVSKRMIVHLNEHGEFRIFETYDFTSQLINFLQSKKETKDSPKSDKVHVAW